MPPPALPVALPARVQGRTVTEPLLLSRPPPFEWAELPEKVLFLSIAEPSLEMPPPSYSARLPKSVLVLSLSRAWLRMPPPEPAVELPERTLLWSVSPPSLEIPPPSPSFAEPPATVSPERLTVAPREIEKRLNKMLLGTAVLRRTVRAAAPGFW